LQDTTTVLWVDAAAKTVKYCILVEALKKHFTTEEKLEIALKNKELMLLIFGEES